MTTVREYNSKSDYWKMGYDEGLYSDSFNPHDGDLSELHEGSYAYGEYKDGWNEAQSKNKGEK